ncbi:MAG: FHA domain-containing protein [Verrucomicrobia bacterium]|nr:FHA domain-containing protein [Verrucomicrobiota bacterium]
MARLVILSEGLTGRSHELKVEKTTVGRVEDNAFQIPEPSVSSHHCEIIQRGPDFYVHDLNSTNGTFVNGQQVTNEALLRPGGVFRLGTVDVRFEVPGAPTAPTPKKLPDHTTAIPQGVKLNELDQAGKTVTFDKDSPFAKKSDKGTKLFIVVAIAAGVLILGAIIFLIATFGKGE